MRYFDSLNKSELQYIKKKMIKQMGYLKDMIEDIEDDLLSVEERLAQLEPQAKQGPTSP